MAEIPDTQHAWTVVRRGTPTEALQLKADWPVPNKLEEGEVFVKVQAAALNPVCVRYLSLIIHVSTLSVFLYRGWKLMRLLPNLLAKRPHVAEHDFSGVVVDANGTEFSKGDNVYGWIPAKLQQSTGQGAIAQYVRVPADNIVSRPPNITPIQAAGVTLTALTSYQALYNTARLEPEQTILINGGSSAVGAYAIQLAKARGAKVVVTASGKNEAFVRSMGADEFIDYTKAPLVQTLIHNPPSTKYHVIFDAVGLIDPSLYTYSASYLSPNGIFITTGPLPQNTSLSEIWNLFRTIFAATMPSWLGNVNRRYTVLPPVTNNKEDLNQIQRLITEGTLKPTVDSVYKFEDVHDAYDRIISRRATGKVVVKVDPSVG